MGVAGSTEALRRHLVATAVLLVAVLVIGVAHPGRQASSPERREVETAAPDMTSTTTTAAPTTTVTLPSTTLAPFTAPTTARAPRATTTTTAAVVVEDTPAPASPTPSAPDAPCGGSRPKAGGGQWQCTWSDEFSGTTLDRSKWTVQETKKSAFHAGAECFVDSPNNIRVGDGSLRLTARWEGHEFWCEHRTKGYTTAYTSGMVMTYGKFTQAYGRFEIRAKLPAVTTKGLQTSFWMWPEDPQRYGAVWPASGEIDIAEWYSLNPERVEPFIHYLGLENQTTTSKDCIVGDVSQFHTYALEWTTDSMTILYDDQVCLTHRAAPVPPQVSPQPFDQPFLLALTQALGSFKNAFDGTARLPATTEIDYVRVWK